MDKFILGFIAVLITSRFFSETIGILPKAVDLIDLAVIPVLLLLAFGQKKLVDVDKRLHRRFVMLAVLFIVISLASAFVNYSRVNIGPATLFIFGMLEGPLLFLSLNSLIHKKGEFGENVGKFLNIMVLAQVATVLFISLPIFIATGNPDKISGTFGNNAYQFSAFLMLVSGYFLGKQALGKRSAVYGVLAQGFVIITFILLQYRTAVPAFFLSFAILIAILYGRKFFRLAIVAGILGSIVYYTFIYINESQYELKYEDLLVVAESPELLLQYGKALSYSNTVDMFNEYPAMLLFGSGPGTYVSRANYTFSLELSTAGDKGVGPILRGLFGNQNYFTDVFVEYIYPLYTMEALFGSTQVNNPNSSVLATVGEVGFPGFIIMFLIYGTFIRYSVQYLRFARQTQDTILLPLASALVMGSIYFCFITPLDNYIEIARVTLPLWFMFWSVSVLVRYRRAQQVEQAYAAALEQQGKQQQITFQP